MSSFQEWMPLLKQRSQPSREALLEDETLRDGEADEDSNRDPEQALGQTS